MLHVAIAGASGRMGRLLLEQVAGSEDTKLVGALEHAGSPELGADAGALVGRPWGVRIVSDPAMALMGADVVIDFSNASATPAVVRAAASVLATVRRDAAEARGQQWSAEDEHAFTAGIREQYEHQGSAYYSTARLWDDGIIDPVDTRRVLGMGLAAAANAPIPSPSYGIFRM